MLVQCSCIPACALNKLSIFEFIKFLIFVAVKCKWILGISFNLFENLRVVFVSHSFWFEYCVFDTINHCMESHPGTKKVFYSINLLLRFLFGLYGIKQAEKMGFYTESLFRCEIILLGHMIIYILVHLICILWFWTILLSFYWQLLLQILLTSMFRLFVGHCSKNYGLFSTRATDSLYSFCQWCNLQCHTSTASIVWWHSNIRGTF